MFAATRLGKGGNIAVVERVLGPRVEVGSRYATEGCGGEHVFAAWCERAMSVQRHTWRLHIIEQKVNG